MKLVLFIGYVYRQLYTYGHFRRSYCSGYPVTYQEHPQLGSSKYHIGSHKTAPDNRAHNYTNHKAKKAVAVVSILKPEAQ